MQAIEFFLTLARRKLLFILLLVGMALAIFIAAGDWSWPHFILLMILLIAALLFWALMTFWILVFRGSRQEGQ